MAGRASRIGAGALALMLVAAAWPWVAAAREAVGASRPTSARPVVHSAPPCRRSAPTSAAGYAAMFAGVDPARWGAADVALSVPLPDGRVVWLFGDTLSTRRFVHSSAIVQTGGCLHVSGGGSQLLPDADATHVYWISSARVVAGGMNVTAREIELTGRGPWDFRDDGHDRVALVRVVGDDVEFARWLGRHESAAPDPGPMIAIDPAHRHHFGYGRRPHPEAQLASGDVLVTTCQNWDDGRPHPFSAYRPLFSEQPSGEAGRRP